MHHSPHVFWSLVCRRENLSCFFVNDPVGFNGVGRQHSSDAGRPNSNTKFCRESVLHVVEFTDVVVRNISAVNFFLRCERVKNNSVAFSDR